jgi:hypothetical protein
VRGFRGTPIRQCVGQSLKQLARMVTRAAGPRQRAHARATPVRQRLAGNKQPGAGLLPTARVGLSCGLANSWSRTVEISAVRMGGVRPPVGTDLALTRAAGGQPPDCAIEERTDA